MFRGPSHTSERITELDESNVLPVSGPDNPRHESLRFFKSFQVQSELSGSTASRSTGVQRGNNTKTVGQDSGRRRGDKSSGSKALPRPRLTPSLRLALMSTLETALGSPASARSHGRSVPPLVPNVSQRQVADLYDLKIALDVSMVMVAISGPNPFIGSKGVGFSKLPRFGISSFILGMLTIVMLVWSCSQFILHAFESSFEALLRLVEGLSSGL